MARIADPDAARDSIEWIQVKNREDKETPWWVMELLACSYDLPGGSMSPRVYGACVAKCLTDELAVAIKCRHNAGVTVYTETTRRWP